MKAMLNRKLVLLALLQAALQGGCSDQETIALHHWTVTLSGSDETTPVALPAHLPSTDASGKRPDRYLLRSEVALPPAFRGKRLTMTVAKLYAVALLRINGEEVALLDHDVKSRYRSPGPLRWSIRPGHTGSDTMLLELVLFNTWTPSGWLDTVPRLSLAAGGDSQFIFVRQWNLITATVGMAVTLVNALIYFFVFMANRRMKGHGWYSLEALAGGLYPAFHLNLTQVLFGRYEIMVVALGTSLAVVAAVYMMHAYLELGPPKWIWLFGWLAHLAIALFWRDPYQGARFVSGFAVFLVAACVWYQIVMYAVAARRRQRRGAMASSLAWLSLALLVCADCCYWMGLGEWLGGWHGGSLGIFIIAMVQALNLSRDHTVALNTAHALNLQLADRLQMLEGSHREIQILNQELRHQIGLRSEQLEKVLAAATQEGTDNGLLQPGSVISDRYRIEDILGQGGMGVVYEVTRLNDERRCALKMTKHHVSSDHLSRLAREAQVLAQIEHPHVISIYDVNVAPNGQLYVVMELAAGTALDREATRYGEVVWALQILRQIAEALEAIHSKHVVHRDLKPSNILLASTDTAGDAPWIKVVDFGLSALLQGVPADMDETLPPGRPPLTQSGMVFGTPFYMAPEYVQGTRNVGPAADIFSLGVIAYELLGRQKPFEDLPLFAAIHGLVLELKSPLRRLCPQVQPDVAEAIERCLSPIPKHRPTAREIAAKLKPKPHPE